MPDDIYYNILLMRPWIHEMNGVPSTLHHIMKYVYNNKVYTLKYDHELESCLMAEREG